MKFIAPLLALFALLTQPNGNTFMIVKAQVEAVFHVAPGECVEGAKAVVTTSSGARFCVTESPEAAAAEIEKP